MVLWHWFWEGSGWKPAQNQCHSTIGPRPIDHSVEELLWEWIWVLWEWIWGLWEWIWVFRERIRVLREWILVLWEWIGVLWG